MAVLAIGRELANIAQPDSAPGLQDVYSIRLDNVPEVGWVPGSDRPVKLSMPFADPSTFARGHVLWQPSRSGVLNLHLTREQAEEIVSRVHELAPQLRRSFRRPRT